MPAPVMAVGLVTRISTFRAPFPVPSVVELYAVDHGYFRTKAYYRFSVAEHRDCPTTELWSQRFHAYGHGRALTEASLRDRVAWDAASLVDRPRAD